MIKKEREEERDTAKHDKERERWERGKRETEKGSKKEK